MTRKWMFPVVAFGLLAVVPATARAQSDDQVVTFEVEAINEIALSGSPSLVISASVAGTQPTAATAGATYAITTNEVNQKIQASLDANMPAGVRLYVEMGAPSGASSSQVQLSTTAVDAVTGISTLNESALDITYELQADASAGVVASDTRTVTFTIMSGS